MPPCLRYNLFPLLLCAFVATPDVDANQPNMVVYLSDDHSQVDSSVYANANIPTLNMQRLANDGMTFTHAFVASPACAPSRAAMLTGLMPARNGAEANHTYPHEGTPSLIENLKPAGYEVVSFGKVAHNNRTEQFGFDHTGTGGGGTIESLRNEVARYLEQRSDERPLCLFVGTSNPHVAWTSPSSFDPEQVEFPPHHLDTPATREHRAAYYQEIQELDELLGDLRDLTNKHLGDRSLFLYTSDHGSQWPFGKWNLYDYGIRVPLIVSWPEHVASGLTSDAMVSWIDLLPTLIEIGGGQAPDTIDGRSFADVLLGKDNGHRDVIFTTHSGDGNRNIYPIRSIRTRYWKLIHNLHPEFAHTNHSDIDRKPMAGEYWNEWAERIKHDPRASEIVDRYFRRPEWELYHVSVDPWEQTNLIDTSEQSDRVGALKSQLRDWMSEQGDRETVYNPPRLLSDHSSWHPDSFPHEPTAPKPRKKK